MSSIKIDKRMLSSEGKNIIAQGRWLEDIHMEHFYHLLKSCSDCRTVSIFQCYISDTIPFISENKKHIKILHILILIYIVDLHNINLVHWIYVSYMNY